MEIKMKTIFILLVCCLALIGCKEEAKGQDNAQVADSYQFISKEFQDAIKNIRPEIFFGSEIPLPPRFEKLSDEGKKKQKLLSADRYFEGLTKQLCGPISESYT